MTEPDLIGREHELERLGAVLAKAEPAVVVVCGRVGVGRHALVHGACRQAGWTLLPSVSVGLYVEPRTTPDGFAMRLRRILAVPSVATDAGDESDLGAARSDPDALARVLASFAPLVLLLERYRPQRAVDRWFADLLLPALRRAEAAVVLAILDPPEDETRLTYLAATRVELGPLEPEVVRPEIEAAAKSACPPIDEAELAVYVQGIAERPGVFDSLVRLFAVELAPNDPSVISPGS
jgi:hypothetical protein